MKSTAMKVLMLCVFLVASVIVISCDNLISTTPYSLASEGGGGGYSIGDELEPGGDDASVFAGLWSVTHRDGDGDGILDLDVETATVYDFNYSYSTDNVYQFYSYPPGSPDPQAALWIGKNAEFFYSASEGIVYIIENGKVTQTHAITPVNEVVDDGFGNVYAAQVIYVDNSNHGYIRAEKKLPSDWLPQGLLDHLETL